MSMIFAAFIGISTIMTEPSMEYNFLGRSGLKVSNICLGTMNFASSDGYVDYFTNNRQLNEEQSHQILDRYVELGGNFIDTANVYSFGKSEKIIGTWLQKHRRDKIVVATKTRFPMSVDNPLRVGLSRRNIIDNCEESLSRLQTNYIDLYQAHHWDNGTPLEETIRTFDDLVRCGKIRYYGFCNVCGWMLQKIVDTAKQLNLSHCISLQQQYNMLTRHSEYEALMVCKNEGVGVIPYGPLQQGLLTGKFERNVSPDKDGSRIGLLNAKQVGSLYPDIEWEKYGNNDSFWTLMDELRKLSEEHGKSVAQVALRWLLQKDVVASVICGVTSVAQLDDNVGASKGWRLSDKEMSKLDSLSPREELYPYSVIWKPMMNGPERFNKFADNARI